eukprot:2686089-Rhodomonas_salina.2
MVRAFPTRWARSARVIAVQCDEFWTKCPRLSKAGSKLCKPVFTCSPSPVSLSCSPSLMLFSPSFPLPLSSNLFHLPLLLPSAYLHP